MGVRAALGAPTGRLFREQLLEHGVLAAVGGIVAVPVAMFMLQALSSGASEILPRGDLIGLDRMALIFGLAATAVTAFVSGAVPAWRSARRAIGDAVRGGERAGLTAGSHRINRALVALEVAAVMVLVVGAGLVVRSLDRLTAVDPGFAAPSARILVTAVPEDAPRQVREQYYRTLTERLGSLPGVAGVGGIHLLPLRAGNWAFPYLAEGHTPAAGAPLPSANFRIVVPGYFPAMGIPLVRGRRFDWTDRADGTRVSLVNEAMANDLWPGEDPLGKTIRLFGSNPLTVVGVVGNVRQFALNQPTVPEYYVPLSQFRAGRMHLVVRLEPGVELSAATLRDAALAVDPTVPVAEITSLEAVRADAVASTRFFARLLVAFGGVAVVLGLAGVFGVTAYVTGSRRPEFGVRLALGASPAAIRWFALRDGMLPVIVGLVMGTVAALGAARLLAGLLFEVTPVDLPTYAMVGGGLLVAAGLACLHPVVRASRTDPVRVLRAE
jgi:predicted permease